MPGRTAGKPVKNAGQTPTVDANHPDVKSLTNAGLGIDRLTQLVTNATKPITHDAISQVPALANQMNEQSLAQQLPGDDAAHYSAALSGGRLSTGIPTDALR